MCLVNTESWFCLWVRHNNNSSSAQGFGSFQTGCCSKTKKRIDRREKKDWIKTQLYLTNTHTVTRQILTTHALIWNSLPCGPPCRRLARCCRRRQTSPRFRAADTQNWVFYCGDEGGEMKSAACVTGWIHTGCSTSVWTRQLQAPVLFYNTLVYVRSPR